MISFEYEFSLQFSFHLCLQAVHVKNSVAA